MKIALLEPLSVPQSTIDALAAPLKAAGHELVSYPTKTTNPAELLVRSQGADIVMIANTPYPASVIGACPQLKLIAVAFTGVDLVDLDAVRARGITLCNCAGYSDTSVAELAVGLAIDVMRRVVEADAATRDGGTAAGFLGREIAGKTVGILGTGHIGCATAKLFGAFGAQVLGYARHENPEALEAGVTYASLEELLAKSDILSLHLPLTNETRGFMNAERLAAMKPGAVLINCARGPIVDGQALAEALKSGRLAGAGIDVYDVEPPLPADNPLLKAPHTTLTPHMAYFTREAMERRARIEFANVEAWLAGKPQNVVS